MKKTVIIFLSIIAVSCVPSSSISFAISENPFIEAVDLEKTSFIVQPVLSDGVLKALPDNNIRSYHGESVIAFPLFSDVHITRDLEDSGVTVYSDEIISFLESNDYPFAINLGDTIDQGTFDNEEYLDFLSSAANAVNGNLIYAIGNHELHDETSFSFDRLLSLLHPGQENSRMVRYTYGPLSIYKLDDSRRTFGRKQLVWLEEALKQDTSPYRIFVAHEIVAAGWMPDHSLAVFGIDPAEAAKLYRIMAEYGVSVLFTGHHHKGNMLYRHSDYMAEFNAAAAHKRDSVFESSGWVYLVELDTIEKEIRITSYATATGEEGSIFVTGLREVLQ